MLVFIAQFQCKEFPFLKCAGEGEIPFDLKALTVVLLVQDVSAKLEEQGEQAEKSIRENVELKEKLHKFVQMVEGLKQEHQKEVCQNYCHHRLEVFWFSFLVHCCPELVPCPETNAKHRLGQIRPAHLWQQLFLVVALVYCFRQNVNPLCLYCTITTVFQTQACMMSLTHIAQVVICSDKSQGPTAKDSRSRACTGKIGGRAGERPSSCDAGAM